MDNTHPNLPGNARTSGQTPILSLISFAMLLVSLDQYIVVVALPEIGRQLGYSAHTLQSVVSAYAVASSGFLLFGGRASDLLGRRRVLVTGLALYALASLAGGLATGPGRSARGTRGPGLGWRPCISQYAGRDQHYFREKVVHATVHLASGAARARRAW